MPASRHAAQGHDLDVRRLEPRRTRHGLSHLRDLAADGFIITADWHIVLCSPAAAKIFKCSETGMIGLPLSRFLRADCLRDESGDVDGAQPGFRTIDAIRANGEGFTAEYRIATVPSSTRTSHVILIRDVHAQRLLQRAISRIDDALAHSGGDLFGEYDVVDDVVSSTAAMYPPDDVLRRVNASLDCQAKRIAHALHDEAGQLLTATYNSLSELGQELPPAALARLGEVRDHLDRVEMQLRRLAHELRPRILDDLGLIAAIGFLAEGVARRRNIVLSVDGSVRGRLPAVVETTLYRVVQEALNNASRHARPGRIDVVLKHCARVLHCSISDDGVGFDPAALEKRDSERGFGLDGIRNQVELLGGTFHIDSAPGRGARLTITVPLGH